jgi:hypothetical protein
MTKTAVSDVVEAVTALVILVGKVTVLAIAAFLAGVLLGRLLRRRHSP